LSDSNPGEARGYDFSYEHFDTPLMRRHRQEAYGQDIGQHSWVTAEELMLDIPRLRLTASSHFLDLGSGPGGPLTFLAAQAGCRATGIDLSPAAIDSARARSVSLGLGDRVDVRVGDSNDPLPFPSGSFDAAVSIDVVLHLRDRSAVFREVARILAPGGRFLFTDAGVVSGALSEAEAARRSIHGFTRFVSPGFNERSLEGAGLRLVESSDRTEALIASAKGRLASRIAHRDEIEGVEGAERYGAQRSYLETVIALSARGAVSRMMYLAEMVPAGIRRT
jgi:SAM-dependent methyltransferase